MVLADALINIPQSERGGEIATRGFDYQSCWALSEMLEYELDERDYVFIFEYHDDVVIVDCEDHPQDLIFVQVKTREKHWTPNNLYGATAKAPTSIVAKQFLLQKSFSSYTSQVPKLMFVTNAVINFSKVGGKNSFDASTLEINEQDNLKIAIREQAKVQKVDLDEKDIDLSTLKFVQSSLSLDDHQVHLKGKLCDFLGRKYGADTNLSIDSLTNLLTTECREKSKFKSDDIIGISDLISKKGFSSRAFNKIIDSLRANDSLRPNWEMAKAIFSTLERSALQLIRLEGVFSRVCIDLNKNEKNPSRAYLDLANNLYDKDATESDLGLYMVNTIKHIDEYNPAYAMALEKSGKKECVVVYSIIQKILEGEK